MPRRPTRSKAAAPRIARGLSPPADYVSRAPGKKAKRAKTAKAQKRPRNAEATRMAILNAALRRFALSSYDDVSLREIASDAGVDVALVGRYFESKDKLFAIVMNELLNPRYLFFGDRATFGQRQA
ncbi:MAG: helix-turn-helix domain-containing protein, partial [Steroidobacteraceae bacterium]